MATESADEAPIKPLDARALRAGMSRLGGIESGQQGGCEMVLPLDRRRAGQPRLPVRLPLVIEPIDSPGGAKSGEAQDLSSGGVQVRVERAFSPRDQVRVTLRPSHRPPLTLTGTVAWVQPDPDVPGWTLGVKFSDELPAEVVAEIADAEYPPWGSSARDGAPPDTR